MIYLIDDHMPQNGELNVDEFATCLKTYSFVPDEEDDIWQDEDAIFFYHASIEDADGILDFIKEYKVPFIKFSGALNDRPEEFSRGWSMQRRTFYSKLRSFLERYNRDNSIDIKSFFDEVVDRIRLHDLIGSTGNEKIIRLTDQFLSQYPLNINMPLEVENFVNTHIKGKDIIVFDLDSQQMTPTVVHYLGTYIRLSLYTIKEAAMAPFIFVGERDFIYYLTKFQQEGCQDILLWAGSMFIRNNSEVIIVDLPQLTPDDYLLKFIKPLKVNPKGITGNHTIANYWGAYVIARHIPGFEAQAKEIYLQALERDALYLKYLIADRIRSVKEIEDIINGVGNKVEEEIEPLSLERHPKILLIDDQDDIWTGVIQALISNAELTVIGKSNGRINSDPDTGFLTPEAETILERSDEFDLILLDLRLGGVAEESIVNGDDCSGMKILKKITDENPGQQVIMFTSSNKAWNLKKALTMAAGYYIKESPLQPFSEDETHQNLKDFLNTIEACLEYYDLKDVVKQTKELGLLEFKDGFRDADIKSEEVRRQLDIVRTMAISQSREIGKRGRNWTYVYFALFQVLEIVKQLNHNYRPYKKGNNTNDGSQSIVRLVSGLISTRGMTHKEFEEYNECKEGLRTHNEFRGGLVHKGENDLATYTDFLDLWEIVYYILCRLSYPFN